ncbi:ADP-heptose--LPS heptosyltransferase [Caballeronia novacaledonica]|uniref:ADP-heptose--LPS heptosyltransferase n=1 Tax=Caballeronia novacaledonica TaxID=1544861 RepID=A0A2U3I6S2_9BURK|nr:ADP-heptose--LPS heptosyltransferase [Caballeronia novacaledonica]SPB15847.1 ADP-heptose--LPS heptosyltransferase [Caballeronia novacaledonica]
MTTLDEVHALTHAGSLLSPGGEIVAPYDLEVAHAHVSGFSALPAEILNAGRSPFDADYARANRVHLVNAFGVTLGDSIIGLSALFAVKRLHPHLRFTIWRPARAPRYVQRLYALAAPALGDIADLPAPLASLPANALRIDIGNQLFWPRFASMPMIDFFLWAMGVAPERIAAAGKRNRWLAEIPLKKIESEPYALFCPDASTPVRSIPASMRAQIVARIAEETGLPVLGFGAVDHPRYRDIAPLCIDTDDFLAWIGHARYLVTADTAALHIAAGFDVPTTAFFTTIPAVMRARDYAHCVAVEFDLPHLQGVHASARPADLEALERVYRDYDWRAMPFAREASLSSACRSPETKAIAHTTPRPSR